MLLRLLAAVLGVLGLVAIALGIASATAWRADDTLTASARAADGTTLVTTAPGLLELADPPVTIRASAPDGAKVVLAVGRDTDVAGWVGTEPHTVITGLEDWHTLAVDEVEPAADAPAEDAPAEGEAPEAEAPAGDAVAAPAPAAAPDPDGSDLWVDQVTGEGEAELVWTPQDGRWTVLAAGVGEQAVAPTVELSWPQTVTTPWLLPGVIGGSVLLLVALALFLVSRRAPRTAPAGAAGTDAGGAATTLSRRERRTATQAARQRETERSAATSTVPVVDAASSATTSVDGRTADAASTGAASSAPPVDEQPVDPQAFAEGPATDRPTDGQGPTRGPGRTDGEGA